MTAIAGLPNALYRLGMNHPARFILRLLGLCLALALLSYAALFVLVPSAWFRAWSQAELSRRTGLEISFDELSIRPPLRLVAESVRVSRPGEFAIESSRVRLTISPLDLWFQTVHQITVERAQITMDLLGVTKTAEARSPAVGFRHVALEQGELILKKGEATVFRLPNIDLAARDLQVGAQAGIRLRADLPSFGAVMEAHITGAASSLSSEIIVRATGAAQKARADRKSKHSDWLRLRAHVEAAQDQPAKASLVGTFENLPVGSGSISGDIDVRATADPLRENIGFVGHAAARNIAAALAAVGKTIPEGAATTDFTGSFSVTDRTLAIESAAIASPLGKGQLAAVAEFTGGAHIRTSKLVWSGLPLSALRTMLPPRLRDWMIDGSADLVLSARGPWTDLVLQGEARSETTKIRGGAWALEKVTFALPFSWSGGSGRIDHAKIAATRIAFAGEKTWEGSVDRAQALATIDVSRSGSFKLTATIEASGGKFQSPDAGKIGENLTVQGPITISSSGQDTTGVTTDLLVESGEILWDKIFVDLRGTRPRVSFDGDYVPTADRVECRRADITLANVGTVSLAGSIERLGEAPQFQIQARSDNFLPGAFFETFLRENLKRQYPVLDMLRLRGAMTFQIRLRGTGKGFAAAGGLSVFQGAASPRSGGWEIGGIGLTLPVAVAWGKATSSGEKPQSGLLTIETIRLGGHNVRLEPAMLTLFNNELRFVEPLHARAFGGELVIADLRWPDLIRVPRQLTLSLTAERLQLEDLTEALDWPSFRGTLTGSIPEIQSSGTTLKTRGEIRAEVFGGRVRISKLEIENPFSSLAAIRADAALANIDLEELSRTFAFGRISGTIEGTVADLVITDGQPAQFGADLHSVDRGGEQRISVEALNKITVLSSGQSAGALYGGLAGLFESFRYSKLGFKAILRNDRLTLRGVESRGDQEYLVVGTVLPPTVNVVSHTQTIGFSELLRRLDRIRTEQPKVQ